jgi:hypothetical protein
MPQIKDVGKNHLEVIFPGTIRFICLYQQQYPYLSSFEEKKLTN